MAAQKNFHKIFTFEQVRGFFKVLVLALPISDYARASFFAQRNRVTFDEAVWISGDAFARVESRESLTLKSCMRQNGIR
jgi:hypothetical protein